jgi:hypothetical protein
MFSSSTNILLLLATAFSFLPAPILADDSDCKVVSYDAFKASWTTSHRPYLGPKGLYSTNTADGSCIMLDVDTPGFADEHPELHESFMTSAQELIDEAAAAGKHFFGDAEIASGLVVAPGFTPAPSKKLVQRATSGCGQYCKAGDSCLYPCYCLFYRSGCLGYDDCYEIYKCR